MFNSLDILIACILAIWIGIPWRQKHLLNLFAEPFQNYKSLSSLLARKLLLENIQNFSLSLWQRWASVQYPRIFQPDCIGWCPMTPWIASAQKSALTFLMTLNINPETNTKNWRKGKKIIEENFSAESLLGRRAFFVVVKLMSNEFLLVGVAWAHRSLKNSGRSSRSSQTLYRQFPWSFTCKNCTFPL